MFIVLLEIFPAETRRSFTREKKTTRHYARSEVYERLERRGRVTPQFRTKRRVQKKMREEREKFEQNGETLLFYTYVQSVYQRVIFFAFDLIRLLVAPNVRGEVNIVKYNGWRNALHKWLRRFDRVFTMRWLAYVLTICRFTNNTRNPLTLKRCERQSSSQCPDVQRLRGRARCKGNVSYIWDLHSAIPRRDSGLIIRTVNYFQAESERLINNSFRGEGKGDRLCALQLSGKHLGELRDSQLVWVNFPSPSPPASRQPASQLVNHREAVCKWTTSKYETTDPLISVGIGGTKTRLVFGWQEEVLYAPAVHHLL